MCTDLLIKNDTYECTVIVKQSMRKMPKNRSTITVVHSKSVIKTKLRSANSAQRYRSV